MDNTILQQGSFTSDGTSQSLTLRSDVDWIKVYNMTELAANQTTAVGVSFHWMRGLGENSSITHFKSNSANAANLDQYATPGFTLIDSSTNPLGTLNSTITAVSNAAIPVVTNTGDNGLVPGDVVRLINVTSAQQLGGFDFTVGHNARTATTFSLDYMSQIATATTGSWRKVNYHPLFYPRRRTITKVTQASQAVITMSVTHEYSVGQKVRFVVPDAYGMVELDGLTGTITAIDTALLTGNTITVDINTTNFTTFAFPLNADVPFSPAEVIPVGQDTAESLSSGVDILSGATENTGFIGVKLAGGTNAPGGDADDVMFWVAGKSFSVDNEVTL